MDAKTAKIAAEWIAKFEAAQNAGDLDGMQAVVDAVCASPNQPFKREVLRQLGM